MALEVYNLTNPKEYLGSIEDFTLIETELNLFKRKTGIMIDQYGTTRLYFDHVKLLVELIKTNKKEINNIKSILKLAVENEHSLLFEGD
jgi:hypothetical protein